MAPPSGQKKARNTRARRCRYPILVGFLVLVGASAVAVGTFAPAVRVDLHGTLRYWDLAGREVFVVLFATLLALRSVPPSRQRRLYWPTLLLWGGIAYPFLEPWILPRRRGFLGRVKDAIGRELTDIATDLAFSFDMVHYTWGTAVFLGGCLLVSVACVLAYR